MSSIALRGGLTNVLPMSSPGAASDHSPTGFEVTPATAAAEAAHHAASSPQVRCSSQPERHQRIPSPTNQSHDEQARNSVPPVSAPPSLKRARTVPSSRSYSSLHPQFPQLSERDSIFATHYLPEDSSDATTTSSPSDHSPSQESVRPPQLTASSPDDPVPPTAPARPSVSDPPSLEPSVAPSPHPASVDDVEPLARSPRPRPGYLRGATDVLPAASGVSLGGSHVGWVRQQESVESSKVAGTHRIAIRETFHPLRKTASDDAGSQGADRDNASRTALGDHPHPGHVPVMRPSLGEPWPAAAHSRSQGNVIVDSKLDLHPSRGRSARVEESIEANLTHTEPAHVRSRKSSHYLGLFKENTSPDRKRREGRERALEKIRSAHEERVELDDAQQTPRPTKATLHTQPAADTPTDRRTVRIDSADDDLAHQRQTLPRNLLEEIRNFHLTTGRSRGGSFSQSIPTKFDEQPHRQGLQSPVGSPPGDSSDRPDSAPEEDDDEHISSALYFPHEPSTAEHGEGFPRFHGQEAHPPAAEIPAHHDGDHRGRVDISLHSRRESSIFRGDYHPVADADAKTLGTTTPEYSHESTSESELVSADESAASTHDEVSSLTDDADLTPKATPTQTYRPRRKHAKAAPVGAVELKPYRHQVGGHTTVFRFSRRAVCKQLNNRENEFYERIEKRHPELLVFLPRYVPVLIILAFQIG